MARILVIVLSLALVGAAMQAPDLTSPSSALVLEDEATGDLLPSAVFVLADPARRTEISVPAAVHLQPRLHVISVFRPPRAVTFA